MSGVVNVFVVSPDTRSERRLDLHLTVQQLKVRGFAISVRSTEDVKLSLMKEQARVDHRYTGSEPGDLRVQHGGRHRTGSGPQ